MATLKSIVDDIVTTANLNSDDSNVDERMIRAWIKNKRAFIIKRRMEARQFHSTNYKQSIPCLEFELVDKSISSCCNNISVGCQVLRSKSKIPKLLSFKGNEALEIRPLDVSQGKFAYVSHDEWIYSGNGRFNKDDVYITRIDGYLYAKSNKKELKNILGKYFFLDAVWEDPEALHIFVDCDGNMCYTDDMEYPIEQDMVDIIKQEILTKELQLNLQIPEDKENNSDANQVQKKT